MPLMKWTQQYSVGYEKMDEQHRIIFDIINDLFDSIRSSSRADIALIMEKLKKFTSEHFGEEEQLLAAHNHPDLAWQQAEHSEFFAVFDVFAEKVETGALDDFEREMSRFLMSWWNKHILEGDKKYKPKA